MPRNQADHLLPEITSSSSAILSAPANRPSIKASVNVTRSRPGGVKARRSLAVSFPGHCGCASCNIRVLMYTYQANKATNANGGLKWMQKGGGYWSECNKYLKE